MTEDVGSNGQRGARTAALAVTAAVTSDRGRLRTTNEDCYLCRPPFFVVADGLGGLAAGEVASRLAVDHLASSQPQPPAPGSLVGLLQAAGRRIQEAADADEAMAGMGTTCTALLVAGNCAEIAHVGDTRAYLLRDGSLRQLTTDHSLAQELVQAGRLTDDQATGHATRHTLTRALGAPGDVQVDRSTLPLRPGDRLMLCSDGLSGLVQEDRVCALLLQGNVTQAADALLAAALSAGGTDNVTVLVVDISMLAVAG